MACSISPRTTPISAAGWSIPASPIRIWPRRWQRCRCWPADVPTGDGTSRAQPDGPESGTVDDGIAAGEALAAALDLELLPLEGGLFRRTFTGSGATAILFMLIGDDFSAMHRLSSDEIYFHHAGSPLRLLLIHPDGGHREVLIGSAGGPGQLPQFVVPANHWQGSSVDGAWS